MDSCQRSKPHANYRSNILAGGMTTTRVTSTRGAASVLCSRQGFTRRRDRVLAGRGLRFDQRSGLAISAVWNQRLGDGGPDFHRLEPNDRLARTRRGAAARGMILPVNNLRPYP